MGITQSTIKSLYAKSGNKCAYPGCNQTLMEDINNSNICHIISQKPNGPRHNPNYIDYDNEENLILLCTNHHNEVDAKINVKKYSVAILHDMREKHEQLIQNLIDNNSEFNELKGILLKGIDDYDIIDIIEKEDYSASFLEYKLRYISNFAHDIDSKILTTYNNSFANSEFISSMKTLSSNLYALSMYLCSNTEISDDGRVIKVRKDKPLDPEHIRTLRLTIANELKKYIQ